jgi:hypothetical protein
MPKVPAKLVEFSLDEWLADRATSDEPSRTHWMI